MTSTIKEHLIAAHTPGPWAIFEPYKSEVQTSSQKTVATCWHDRAEGRDITVRGVNDCSPEESSANARLIAAAPDLLEALKAALAQRADNTGAVPLHPDAQKVHDQCVAAIAKAEGRLP